MMKIRTILIGLLCTTPAFLWSFNNSLLASQVGSDATMAPQIEAAVDRTEVEAESPLILTLRITAPGWKSSPLRRVGKRAQILKRDQLEELFDVEDLPDRDRHPKASSWEHSFRLRPLHAQVTKVPRLGIELADAEHGVTSIYTEAIALKVNKRAATSEIKDNSFGSKLFAQRFPLRTGSAVLARQDIPTRPGVLLWALAVVLPSCGCLAWYIFRRRWYPDAVGQVRQNRSRAAKLALRAIHTLPSSRPPLELAQRLNDLVSRYLRQKFDVPGAEPTPVEIAQHLRQIGLADGLVQHVAKWYGVCDAWRFSSAPDTADFDLTEHAIVLIHQLEAAKCAPPSS